MKRKFMGLILSGILAFALLCGCSNGNGSKETDTKEADSKDSDENSTDDSAGETVKIGLIVPTSGSSAYDGESAINGAKVAVNQINAAGGINGKTLELIVEDSASSPETSVSAAEKLISSDQVKILIGAFNSSSTGAVMPIAEENKVPLITAISTSSTLTEQGNQWFFRAVGTSDYFIDSFVQTVLDKTGATKIAYICENGDWGKNSVNAFKTAAEAVGCETTTEQLVSDEDSDLYTQLTAIKNSEPDMIYAVANLANAVRIAQEAQELGITLPIVGEGAWASGDFFEMAGEAAEGIYGIVEYLPDIDSEMNRTFYAEYEELAGKTPDKYAACEYNAVLVAADALIRAADLEDPETIREALTETDIEILSGPIRFMSNGQGYGFDIFLSHNEDGVAVLAGSAKVESDE